MAKKTVDSKQKDKRQKLIAAVGGVLLLGLLAFQVPRTMKLLHGQQQVDTTAAATSAAPAPGSTVPLAPPTLDGGAPATGMPATAGADGVADPAARPAAASGQLLSFGAPRFRSHDPFVQQVNTESDGSTPVGGGTGSTTVTPPPTGGPGGSSGSDVPTSGGGSGGLTPTAPPGTGGSTASSTRIATISVNGAAQQVRVGATFPQTNPIFRLVAAAPTAARVAIVGGSFTSGQATVSLAKGVALTLMNTADGTQYTLRLLAVTTNA